MIRYTTHQDTEGLRPVITIGGVMPGGSENVHWKRNLPFPDVGYLAKALARGDVRTPRDRLIEAETHGTPERQMALGECYRPAGTDCPHDYECVRCSFLRMDPDELPRLLQIEESTRAQLVEAEEQGWEGEATGLKDALVHVAEKKAQVEQMTAPALTGGSSSEPAVRLAP